MQPKKIVLMVIALVLAFPALAGLKFIAEGFRKVKAFQFVVNSEAWFIVSQRDSLEKMLHDYKQQYLKEIDHKARVKKISFAQKVEIVEVEVKPEKINTLAEAKKRIYAVAQNAVEIEVKPGDSFWDLAKANQLSVSELEILNPNVDPDKIYPGDKLKIRAMDPVLDVIIELENTIIEPIPFANEYQKSGNLYKSQKWTVRKGAEGQKEVVYHIKLRNGYQDSLEIKREKVLKAPVNAIIQIGTKTTVSRGGRINYGVVSGKRISSYFGYRIHPITGRKRYHEGLDIAASSGNGVYAYTDGRVVAAGWNGGYGIQIVLDHGNGLKTRYAHLSKVNIRVGQWVKTGARIGSVGSTGNSTGPHLHFEVIKNGRTQNPLNYI